MPATNDEAWEVRGLRERVTHIRRPGEQPPGDGGSIPPMDPLAELKADVSSLKSDVSTLKGDVSTLKGDVGALKTYVQGIDTKIEAAKSSLIQWMAGITLGGAAIVVSVVIGFGAIVVNVVKQQPPSPPQPIVIQVPLATPAAAPEPVKK